MREPSGCRRRRARWGARGVTGRGDAVHCKRRKSQGDGSAPYETHGSGEAAYRKRRRGQGRRPTARGVGGQGRRPTARGVGGQGRRPTARGVGGLAGVWRGSPRRATLGVKKTRAVVCGRSPLRSTGGRPRWYREPGKLGRRPNEHGSLMRRRDRSAAADGGTAWRAFPFADGGTAWSQRRRTTSPYKVADTQTSREVKDTPTSSMRVADATNVTPRAVARRS